MTTPENNEIFNRVATVLEDILKVDLDKITLDSRFNEDLTTDSLDKVTLLMALEEEFNESISDEDAQRLVSVGTTVEYIEKKLMEKNRG